MQTVSGLGAKMADETPKGPPARPDNRRRRLLRAGVALLIMVGGGYWGFGWLEHRLGVVIENDARIAADMISISSRVEGWVVKVPVGQGAKLKAGDLILQIDSREAEQKLKELAARIKEIKAERDEVLVEIRVMDQQTNHRLAAQKYRVEASKAALGSAVANVGLKKSELKRIEALAARRIASAQRLEQASSDLRVARQNARRVEAELASSRAVLLEIRATGGKSDALREQVTRLKAEQEQAFARYEQQRLNLEDRKIISPVAGVIDKTFIDAGEFVRPGQRLALIHDPNNIWIDANIRETDIRDVRLGAPVTVFVDAFPGRTFQGEVVRIGSATTSQFALLPSPNPSGNFTKISQRIPIKIRIPQEDGKFLPGMMVEIEISAGGDGGGPS